MIRTFFLLFFVLIGSWTRFVPAREVDLQRKLDQVFLPPENWSAAVADLETGEILYEKNALRARLPASNLKLYVTAAALDLLGTRFRYRTPLMGRGYLDRRGVWRGDLLVRGSGDPTFSGRFEQDKKNVTGRLERWARRLVNQGVREISGNLYGDDDIFDEDYWGKGWPDGSWSDWYTAPSGGLILNDSCIDVAVYPGKKVGSPPRITKIPRTGFVHIRNRAKTVSGGGTARVGFRRSFGGNDLELFGKVPIRSRGTQHAVALANPTDYFITVFREVLEANGIRVDGTARDADEAPGLPTGGWKVLAWSQSPPLTEIVRVTNQRSQNLYADTLLKTLGARKLGMGNWAGGAQVVREWVRSLGVSVENLHLQDGSGLSRLNRITAHDTLRFLLAVSNKPWFGDWKRSLPVSGDPEGSLRRRLKTPLLHGRVHAKTGYINDVYCLSGYVETPRGNEYVFSFLFNGRKKGKKHPHSRMEEALTLLAKEDWR